MFDRSQLMKGTLEGCILLIICRETTYGYEIMEKLIQYGFAGIREGTIYPLLVRLEKKHLIASEYRISPLGPSRKYYLISPTAAVRLLRNFQRHGRIFRRPLNAYLAEEKEMSELSQLRKKNNELEKELTKENSDLITRMYFYLVSSSLKEIEVEIIRKDLTGMALEAQERGESFADVIGEDYKRFCDELRSQTAGEKHRAENFLRFLNTCSMPEMCC